MGDGLNGTAQTEDAASSSAKNAIDILRMYILLAWWWDRWAHRTC